MKLSVDCCRGAWLLLNFAWATSTLYACLRLLRESQAKGRRDWVPSDRASVRFWVDAVRQWRAEWVRETFPEAGES